MCLYEEITICRLLSLIVDNKKAKDDGGKEPNLFFLGERRKILEEQQKILENLKKGRFIKKEVGRKRRTKKDFGRAKKHFQRTGDFDAKEKLKKFEDNMRKLEKQHM